MSDSFSPIVTEVLSRMDQFTEEELLHLNRLVVERIRLIQQVKAHRAMTQFRVGQRVQFTARDGRVIVGTLAKYNRKSVSILTENGGSWTVSPSLLLAVTAG